jgi:hypothetical protein
LLLQLLTLLLLLLTLLLQLLTLLLLLLKPQLLTLLLLLLPTLLLQLLTLPLLQLLLTNFAKLAGSSGHQPIIVQICKKSSFLRGFFHALYFFAVFHRLE